MRAWQLDNETSSNMDGPKQVHSQLLRWAMHDQDQRERKFKPFLQKHAAQLAKDGSKANAMRLWYGTDKVDATRHFDPMQDTRWHAAAKRFIRDNIDTILRDPGGWTSQRDGHAVVLAHIIVQHMDEDPDFQEWFLDRMRENPSVVRANADQIRYLADRVEVNRSGYWNRPDAGADPKSIPRGSYGTQGNRYSMDHSRTQALTTEDHSMDDMRRWIDRVSINEDHPMVGDGVWLEFYDQLEVDTEILEMTEDSMTLLGDERLLEYIDLTNEAMRKRSLARIEKAAIDHAKQAMWNWVDNDLDAVDDDQLQQLLQKLRVIFDQQIPQLARSANTARLSDAERMIERFGISYAEWNRMLEPYKKNILSSLQREMNDDPARARLSLLSLKHAGLAWPEIAKLSAEAKKRDMAQHGQDHRPTWHVSPEDIMRNRAKMAGGKDDMQTQTPPQASGRPQLSLVKEAEYHGRTVPLGKPMRGDVKKFKVYVKDPKTGNVKKVNFGDKTMKIKKSNPKRRKSFRARHHCENPGPRTKARYWSCRKW